MSRNRQSSSDRTSPGEETVMRIVGGEFGGRLLRYHGDRVVRPMKHSTREAIFNLVSTEVSGLHVIDLFAGTGALGLESLSRGATTATFIERHVPSARVVRENIESLGVEARTTMYITSAFLWSKRDLPQGEKTPPADQPWLVFCSPPYAFYTERQADMLGLLGAILEHAPPESIVIVEADEHLDFDLLPIGNASAEPAWDVRTYAPAVVGVWRGA